jgi:hypothetical protein
MVLVLGEAGSSGKKKDLLACKQVLFCCVGNHWITYSFLNFAESREARKQQGNKPYDH